jgi:O-antigen/teichoic acid export membrane protein
MTQASRPGSIRSLLERYRSIIGQGAWVVAGQATTGLFTLGGTRLITQFVSPELYGAVNLIQNATVLLRTVFCSPILNAALRYYPDAERGSYIPALRSLLSRFLGRGLIAMELITVVAALVWCSLQGRSPPLTAFVALDVIRTMEMTLFNAARRQRAAAILSAFETLLRPLLVVAGILVLGGTTEVIMGAFAASIFLALALLYSTMNRPDPARGDAPPRALSADMWRYAIPLIPVAVLSWTSSVSDRYIIEWASRDMASIGVYSAGYGLISQPFLLMHGVVALTLRPVYFAAVSRGDQRRAQHTFATWISISAVVCAAATVVIYWWREPLVAVFLGPKYRGAVVFVPWIALGYFFYVIEQVMEQTLLAHNRTKLVLIAQSCGAVASVIVTVPLVMHFGALGAAYACPAYFLIQLLTVVAMLRRNPGRHAA